MKLNKLFLLLSFLTIGLFASCKKDEDKGGGSAALVGTWTVNDVLSLEIDKNTTPEGVDTIFHISGPLLASSYVTLSADNKFSLSLTGTDADKLEGTYSVNGDRIILNGKDEDGEEEVIEGRYTISGNRMTIRTEEADEDNYVYVDILNLTRK